MALFGYARVSSAEQDLSIQLDALKNAGCEIIRAEKVSGTSTQGRAELQTLLEFIREGDTLMVTRIDRLARSTGDLQDIVRVLAAKGAALKATEQPVDTSTASGRAFLDMLGVFACFETNLRKERQIEGIRRCQREHPERYRGRPSTIKADDVRRLRQQGMGATAIARELGIARASVYRLLAG